jgi:hypothetical protein
MRVDSDPAISGLRLVQPAQAVKVAPPVDPAPHPAEAAATDAHSFESIYLSRLPRMPVTEAHKKLEQLRNNLVAGQVNVPIHFEQPGVQVRTANPYSIGFVRFAGSPAELNTRATDQAADAAE